MTTTIVPQVEKSIRYDKESGDYCCTLTIDGEPISLGYQSTYSQGEEWCNAEYYRILQDGVALPPREEPAPAEPLPFEPTAADAYDTFIRVLDVIEQHAPAGFFTNAPRLRFPELPPVAISTLADGSTVYGSFDNDDSHLTARVEASDGWTLHGDENNLDVYHRDYDFKLHGITHENVSALRALVNSGAIEHMLVVGAAWEGNQEIPIKQPVAPTPPAITIEQKVWDDIRDDEDEPTYTSTVYRCGQAEVMIHHDVGAGNLTAYDLVVNNHNMDARDVQGIFDAGVLLKDARVREALAAIGLPVPVQPPAPTVAVSRWVDDETGEETGTDYTLGHAEVHIPDNGTEPVLWLDAVDGQPAPFEALEPRWWTALSDAAALVACAELRRARLRVEAGVTALPQRQIRRAA